MQLPTTSSFEKRQLAWRIYDLLATQNVLKSYWSDQVNSEIKRWDLAKKLSTIFQDYQTYRADWLKEWTAGNLIGLGSEEHWQSHLWQCLVDDVKDGSVPIFEQQEAIIDAAVKKEQETSSNLKKYFGEKVFVIVTPEMLPILKLLQAIDNFAEIHLLWLNPCKEYWVDSPRWWLESNLGFKRKTALPPPECNALLASWGQQSALLLERLITMTDSVEELFHIPQKNSQLNHLKRALLHDSPFMLDEPDDSLQLIETDSITNEIEIARQQIESELILDPSICLHECTIACAQYENYAPFISAVFHNVWHSKPHYSPDELCTDFLQLLDFIARPNQPLWKWQAFLKSDSVLRKLNERATSTTSFTPEHMDKICEALFQLGVREGPLTPVNKLSGLDWDKAFAKLTAKILAGNISDLAMKLSFPTALKDSQSLRIIYAYIKKLCFYYECINEKRSIAQWQAYFLQLSQSAFSETSNSIRFLLEKWQSEVISNDISWEVALQSLQDLMIRNRLSGSATNNGGVRCLPLNMAHAIPCKIMLVLGVSKAEEKDLRALNLMQEQRKIDDSSYMATLNRQLINTALATEEKLIFIQQRDQARGMLTPIIQLLKKSYQLPEKRKPLIERTEASTQVSHNLEEPIKTEKMFNIKKLIQFMQNPLKCYLSHRGIKDIYDLAKALDKTKWEEDDFKSNQLMRIHGLLKENPSNALSTMVKELLAPDDEVLKEHFQLVEKCLARCPNLQKTPMQKVRLEKACCYGSGFYTDEESYWFISGAKAMNANIKIQTQGLHLFLCAAGGSKPMRVVFLDSSKQLEKVFEAIEQADASEQLDAWYKKWQNGLKNPWYYYPKASFEKQKDSDESSILNALNGERGDMENFGIKQLSKYREIEEILADI